MPQYTPSLRINLQDLGSNEDTWGDTLNKQFELLEDSIAGTTRIVLAGNDYELTTSNGSEDESRSMILNLVGNPNEKLNVIVPSESKLYLVRNNTTGNQAISIRTRLGEGVDVPNGESRIVYCDGTDVLFGAKAEDTRLVGGKTPGDAVTYSVDKKGDDKKLDPDTLLSLSELDKRFLATGSLSSVGYFTTGDTKFSIKQTEAGWVRMRDGTIGPSKSGATDYADDDAQALYEMLWNNLDDDYAKVSGGRGATAKDDWAGRKPIKLPLSLGRALAGAGQGDGFESHDVGSSEGEEKHRQTVDELAEHDHDYTPGVGGGGPKGAAYTKDHTDDKKTGKTGGGKPFNVLGPRTYMNLFMKL